MKTFEFTEEQRYMIFRALVDLQRTYYDYNTSYGKQKATEIQTLINYIEQA